MAGLRRIVRPLLPLLVAFLTLSASIPAEADPLHEACGLLHDLRPCTLWSDRTLGVVLDEALPVSELSPDGSRLIQAATGGGLAGWDGSLLVTVTDTASGQSIFRVGLGLSGPAWPMDIAVDPSTGEIHIATIVQEATAFAGVLASYDIKPNGSWSGSASYTPSDGRDWGYTSVAAAGGRVFASGFVGSETDDTYDVVVTARGGPEPSWSATYPFTDGMDFALDSVLSPAIDRLYLAVTAGPERLGGLATLAIDTADGQALWESIHAEETDTMAYGIHLSPGGDTVYLATTAGAFASDAATGAEGWRHTYHEPIPWDSLVLPFASALSADGTTMLLVNLADSGGPNRYVRLALLDATDGSTVSSAAFALAPGGDTVPFTAALSPSGDRAYIGGTVTTSYEGLATLGDPFLVGFAPDGGGWTSIDVPDRGAPATTTGAFVSADGAALYVTGLNDVRDEVGYLYATAFKL